MKKDIKNEEKKELERETEKCRYNFKQREIDILSMWGGNTEYMHKERTKGGEEVKDTEAERKIEIFQILFAV